MNETIGEKGGKRDLKRRLLITQNMKKKLMQYQEEQKEKELVELEKKIKFQQKITFLKILPIVTIGQIYENLVENKEKKKELALKEAISLIEKENLFNERETKEVITALKNGTLFSLEEELLAKLGISLEGYKRTSEIDLTDFANEEKTREPISEEPIKENEVSQETKTAVLNVVELSVQEKQEQLFPSQYEQQTKKLAETPTNNQDKKIEVKEDLHKKGVAHDTTDDKLDKIKNHKIVDEYEKKLKEVRLTLRELIFEYNLISETTEQIYESKEAEDLLERLNEIIKKIEELKSKIDVPNIEKYDDNYLYSLIEDYIKEFKNKNFVDEIKDSSLYIMISEKLEELDAKKDILEDKIETKKTKLEVDETRLEEVREKYNNYEKFNKELLNFQIEQDRLLDEIREKMATATTIQEQTRVQVTGMRRQSRRLLTLLGTSMMIPGARSARGLATMAATYLYFMRNVMRPNTVRRRYKTVRVENYHKEIENSINQLDDISNLLTKTSKQIDNTIKEFEKEFKEYLDVIPDCRKLLLDLEKLKDEIHEKEFELARIKDQQEKNLAKNDAKVKTLNLESTV